MKPLRVWLDIANAPHVNLFRPVTERLVAHGHEVVVTAWDRGQTRALALSAWPDAIVVGAGFRRPLLSKATAIWDRARELVRIVQRERVDVALGHNSYAQLVAARRIHLPSLTMMDYEHQPANHLAFRVADRVILPEAIPDAAVRRFGLRPDRIVRYGGVKEEIALAAFVPEPSFRAQLGVNADAPLVVVRPAAEGALYHRKPNRLFDAVLQRLAGTGSDVLLAPRTGGQANRYEGRAGVRVLADPVSGPNLLYEADLFVGAGGTMTREAAVLGTPSYSLFEGKPAAVDEHLIRMGRMSTLRAVDDLPQPTRHARSTFTGNPSVVDAFVELVVEQAQRLRHDG